MKCFGRIEKRQRERDRERLLLSMMREAFYSS